MANGWERLGAVLGGGGSSAERSRMMGMEQGSRQAGLLEDARTKRDKNLGLEQITPQLLQGVLSGNDPITGQPFVPEASSALQSQLVSALLHAGIDPQHVSGYQKDRQTLDFGNRAMDAATAEHPDLNLLQRINMARNGKPVAMSTVQGNTLINALVTPDQQAAVGGNVATPIGLADIMLKGSQAGAAGAQANASNALTRLRDTQTAAGGFNPNTGASTGKITYPTAPDAAAYLGDPQNAAAFTAWRSQHPELTDGNQAWIAFRSSEPIGAPTGEPATDGGMVPTFQPAVPSSLPTTPAELQDLAQVLMQGTGVAKPAAPSLPGKSKAAPAPGTSEGGYIFKGGDPADPANWVKASALLGAGQ